MAAEPKTILVVEDNLTMRSALAVVLRHNRYNVVTAENGQEALDELRSEDVRPDLILLDMFMPRMDGWQFLAQLRAARAAPPVVITTACPLKHEWTRANRCAGFLQKPYEEADLIAEVRRVLGEA